MGKVVMIGCLLLATTGCSLQSMLGYTGTEYTFRVMPVTEGKQSYKFDSRAITFGKMPPQAASEEQGS